MRYPCSLTVAPYGDACHLLRAILCILSRGLVGLALEIPFDEQSGASWLSISHRPPTVAQGQWSKKHPTHPEHGSHCSIKQTLSL